MSSPSQQSAKQNTQERSFLQRHPYLTTAGLSAAAGVGAAASGTATVAVVDGSNLFPPLWYALVQGFIGGGVVGMLECGLIAAILYLWKKYNSSSIQSRTYPNRDTEVIFLLLLPALLSNYIVWEAANASGVHSGMGRQTAQLNSIVGAGEAAYVFLAYLLLVNRHDTTREEDLNYGTFQQSGGPIVPPAGGPVAINAAPQEAGRQEGWDANQFMQRSRSKFRRASGAPTGAGSIASSPRDRAITSTTTFPREGAAGSLVTRGFRRPISQPSSLTRAPAAATLGNPFGEPDFLPAQSGQNAAKEPMPKASANSPPPDGSTNPFGPPPTPSKIGAGAPSAPASANAVGENPPVAGRASPDTPGNPFDPEPSDSQKPAQQVAKSPPSSPPRGTNPFGDVSSAEVPASAPRPVATEKRRGDNGDREALLSRSVPVSGLSDQFFSQRGATKQPANRGGSARQPEQSVPVGRSFGLQPTPPPINADCVTLADQIVYGDGCVQGGPNQSPFA